MVAPPVPIPNTEVKRHSADGSACIACARVGRCQYYAPFLGNKERGFFCTFASVGYCQKKLVPSANNAQSLEMTVSEIYSEDCIQGLKDIAAGSVDVVVTSPPYNLGIAYRTYKDRLDRAAYLDWSKSWGREVHRVLKTEGALFLNLGASNREPALPFEVLIRLTGGLFHLQNTIHWVKAISLPLEDGKILSKGHFKPINSRRYLNDCHEYIFHLTKTGAVSIDRLAVGVPYADKTNISRWSHTKGNDCRCGGNMWFIPYRTIQSRGDQRPHPATFPVELVERCIRLHGRSKPVVLDPFLGLGSSAEAAIRQGATRFIGFEIDSEYAAFARRRVDEVNAQIR